jgi:hypothetical protein
LVEPDGLADGEVASEGASPKKPIRVSSALAVGEVGEPVGLTAGVFGRVDTTLQPKFLDELSLRQRFDPWPPST